MDRKLFFKEVLSIYPKKFKTFFFLILLSVSYNFAQGLPWLPSTVVVSRWYFLGSFMLFMTEHRCS